MCVTNTANRRAQPVSFNSNNVAASPSLLSQRLFGSFLPTSMPVKSVGSSYLHTPTNNLFSTMQSNDEKTRPKRRRKPQKPGKTAKNNERHFVVHDYHDHSLDSIEFVLDDVFDDLNVRRRGGVSVAFPLKLHAVLDQVEADGLAHVISWQGHGRAFLIHKPKEFVEHVMPL
jgi:HSF-type DNA-binding